MDSASPTESELTKEEKWWLSKWRRHDFRVDLYNSVKHGPKSLYTPSWDALARAEIIEELSKEIGEPTPFLKEVVVEEADLDNAYSNHRYRHCLLCKKDVTEFEHDNWFSCEKCHKAVPTVWGCLDCLHISCPACTPFTRSHTLEEVAKELGVTRERIRQIEAKALRKLQHPSNNWLLIPFISENLTELELYQIRHPGRADPSQKLSLERTEHRKRERMILYAQAVAREQRKQSLAEQEKTPTPEPKKAPTNRMTFLLRDVPKKPSPFKQPSILTYLHVNHHDT